MIVYADISSGNSNDFQQRKRPEAVSTHDDRPNTQDDYLLALRSADNVAQTGGVDELIEGPVDFVGRARRRTQRRAGALIGAVIFILIAYTVWESAKISQLLNLRTNILGWPRAYFQWALCAFALVSALALILRALLSATGRDDEPAQTVPTP